jgi:hypothetical protein
MTLAAIALFFFMAPISAAQASQAPQTNPPPPPHEPSSPEAVPATPSETKPSAQTAAKRPPGSRKARSTRAHSRKRKAAASPCVATAATDHAESSNASTAPVDPPAQAPAQHSNASKECPPSKIIVRQGGTKEPSIQLAGGTGNQAARDGINELLGKTDENLKRTSGMQLTTSQQDTVTQTRQFVEQSKAAMSQGDFERARTLAWKAQLLSDDLVKPENNR